MGKKKKKSSILFDENGKIGNEVITQMNVADADLNYIQLFAANKNLYRTISSLQDGLKPGKRRLFYSWWEKEGKPQNTNPATLKKLKFYKVSELAAGVVRYHPHGDANMSDLIGREGQYWNNNVMTVVPHGSYGNMRGDVPAAGRYRTAKISEYMIDCFFDDFNKYCVPMKLSYNGVDYEPEYFPSKYPNILFNPQFSGIGFGMASNIPPFNVKEVLEATIKLMKNPKAKILLIPDSPTGCDVLDEGLFKAINKTGQAKVTFRATTEIDYVENKIHVSSLPINSSSKAVINKITVLKTTKVKNGENIFEDIIEIKDSTKEGEVDLDIYLKPEAKADKILAALYKKNIGLKSTFPVGITVIDDYKEYEYGVKDLLLEWIEYRRDAVRSMHLNNLRIIMEKIHMNDVLLMVFNKDNINTTIRISRNAKNKKEMMEKLMSTFHITSLQASTIADMHIYQFNKDIYAKFKEEKKSLADELKKIESILSSDKNIDAFIIDQLNEGIKKYGRPRKSKVVKEDDSGNENIPDTEHLVGISESGYIKKLSLKNNDSIGVVGTTNSTLNVLQLNNRENLLVIDSKGYITKVSISAIPNMNYDEVGVELNKFFNIKGTIKAVMELPSMDILKVRENFSILFITRNGIGKKVKMNEFKNLADTKIGIKLNKGDEVAAAIFVLDDSDKDVIVATNKGDGIRIRISDFKTYSPSAKGTKIISLKENEHVVSLSKINPNQKLLFYVTNSGRVKVTELKYFPRMKLTDSSLSLISLQGNEDLIGVASVNKNDAVIIYKKKSNFETLYIKDLEISMRSSKGQKLIKTPQGDKVVAYKIFKK